MKAISKEVVMVLAQYPIEEKSITGYKVATAPDHWAHAFAVEGIEYLLLETDYSESNLKEYVRKRNISEDIKIIAEDLKLDLEKLELVEPKLEQLHTERNPDGLSVDANQIVIDPDTKEKYRNPLGLRGNTVFTLFRIK